MVITTSAQIVLPTLPWRQYNKTSHATPGTVKAMTFDAVAASSLTSSGTTATFTTAAGHRLPSGILVTVSGATESGYNVLAALVTKVSATVFTYPCKTTPSATPATGSPVFSFTPVAQHVMVYAASTNSATPGEEVFIGPDDQANFYPLSPGQVFTIPNVTGARFDLSTWYFKSAAASQAISILFR